jgi:hypothetical protein
MARRRTNSSFAQTLCNRIRALRHGNTFGPPRHARGVPPRRRIGCEGLVLVRSDNVETNLVDTSIYGSTPWEHSSPDIQGHPLRHRDESAALESGSRALSEGRPRVASQPLQRLEWNTRAAKPACSPLRCPAVRGTIVECMNSEFEARNPESESSSRCAVICGSSFS